MTTPTHTAMVETRERTLALVAHLDDAQLEETLTPLLSPLAWDLGHIAAYEDLWINHRLAGRPLMRPGLAELYDAFETPRATRAALDFLRGDELRDYLAAVRTESLRAPLPADAAIHEMVIRHELQHTETMVQAMALGDRLPPGWHGAAEVPDGASPGQEAFVEFDAGEAAIGAPEGTFAYDNELPRHRVRLGAFAIARRPVTNASWLSFVEGGGYERREWWPREAWAWKQDHDIAEDAARERAAAEGGAPDAPVVHLSWFAAAAFARAHGARLPTEAEWERAATAGRLDGVGEVWEWTGSEFGGYPGFRAHPYREYSEVFFGRGYRVLRGWSHATAPRVRSPHFRNWDLPQRRLLFAGVRVARDRA